MWLAFVLATFLALASIPRWSMPVHLRCVLEPARVVVLHAPEDARVVQVLCGEGEPVEAGQVLLKLEATELSSEVAQTRLTLALHRDRERAAQAVGDVAAWRAEHRVVAAQQSALDQLTRRIGSLTVATPLAGTCLTAGPGGLLGRAVLRGAPLLTIGETRHLRAVAHVAPAATWDLRPGATALLMPRARPGTVLRGRIQALLPAAPAEPSGFRLTVSLPAADNLKPGMTGSLKVYGTPRSLLGHLREAALRLIRADLWG